MAWEAESTASRLAAPLVLRGMLRGPSGWVTGTWARSWLGHWCQEGGRREDVLLCGQQDCGLMRRPLSLWLGVLFAGGDGSQAFTDTSSVSEMKRHVFIALSCRQLAQGLSWEKLLRAEQTPAED